MRNSKWYLFALGMAIFLITCTRDQVTTSTSPTTTPTPTPLPSPPNSGSIIGKIILKNESGDSTYSDNSGVKVTIDTLKKFVITDKDGNYKFDSIPYGVYGFTYSKIGYGTFKIPQMYHGKSFIVMGYYATNPFHGLFSHNTSYPSSVHIDTGAIGSTVIWPIEFGPITAIRITSFTLDSIVPIPSQGSAKRIVFTFTTDPALPVGENLEKHFQIIASSTASDTGMAKWPVSTELLSSASVWFYRYFYEKYYWNNGKAYVSYTEGSGVGAVRGKDVYVKFYSEPIISNCYYDYNNLKQYIHPNMHPYSPNAIVFKIE